MAASVPVCEDHGLLVCSGIAGEIEIKKQGDKVEGKEGSHAAPVRIEYQRENRQAAVRLGPPVPHRNLLTSLGPFVNITPLRLPPGCSRRLYL